jgi:hypothetical protein
MADFPVRKKKMTMCEGMKNSNTKHLRAPPNKNDSDAEQNSHFWSLNSKINNKSVSPPLITCL